MGEPFKWQGSAHERHKYWAVRVNAVDGGRPSFATNEKGGVYLFGNQQAAQKFCNELQVHLKNSCSVVPVVASVTEVET